MQTQRGFLGTTAQKDKNASRLLIGRVIINALTLCQGLKMQSKNAWAFWSEFCAIAQKPMRNPDIGG